MSGTDCPAWCPGEHPEGSVHRAEVGTAIIGDHRIPVVILKVNSRMSASLVISGPVYVEVHPDDHEDMANLLTMSGQPVLAALIRKAAEIAKESGR